MITAMMTRHGEHGECGGHVWPVVPGPNDKYSTKRCAHCESRYIVELCSRERGSFYIGYIQEKPFLYEDNFIEVGDDADVIWERMYAKMLNDVPPEPGDRRLCRNGGEESVEKGQATGDE